MKGSILRAVGVEVFRSRDNTRAEDTRSDVIS
jgi:hypothetical protein